MNKATGILKPLMPILSAIYGLAVIYVTALPIAGDNPSFVGELLTWLLTLAAIALTLFLVCRVEPKVFPSANTYWCHHYEGDDEQTKIRSTLVKFKSLKCHKLYYF